jgi:hypothetical protein
MELLPGSLTAICASFPQVVLGLISVLLELTAPGRAAGSPADWKEVLRQPASWYESAEAARIADNVLLYQRRSGGWPKNLNMAAVLSEAEQGQLRAQKQQLDSTIDNGATRTQLRLLARVYRSTKHERFKDSFLRGLDFLLAAQYENGGWPQFHPKATGSQRHVTFNDDAMVNVLNLLRA